MSDKHQATPGPWSGPYLSGALRYVARNVDSDQFLSQDKQDEISEGLFNVPNHRNPADVAAIVAAPDLLASLEKARAALNRYMYQHGDLYGVPVDLLAEIDATLSKAKP